MTFKQIEKEFDERFTPDWWMGFGASEDINELGIGGIKSFLKQSFIKYLHAECDSLEEWDMRGAQNAESASHINGYNQCIKDQRERLQVQIKELEA